jgi:peptide methionine sulfoxide reductase msrA/msrB
MRALVSDVLVMEDRMRRTLALAALAMVPVAASVAASLPVSEAGADAPNKGAAVEEVVDLAGGCFWGMEHILHKVPGVLRTEVGYTGGQVVDATYPHHEGHAEAVRVYFDPRQLPFDQLLRVFFRMHDPTTRNRQGNDIGTSYRSAIFFHSEAQRVSAEAMKARVDKNGKWGAPLVTEIVPAGQFWTAEEYHQKYLVKNPGGYTCHRLRPESILGN